MISFGFSNGWSDLTTTSLGKLSEAQKSVIARNGLESDITVPFPPGTLLLLVTILVEGLSFHRADDANLVVFDAVLTSRVDNWVNV
jgi:hypothetical protein